MSQRINPRKFPKRWKIIAKNTWHTYYAGPRNKDIFFQFKLKSREIDNSYFIIQVEAEDTAIYYVNPGDSFVDRALNARDYFLTPAIEIASGDIYNSRNIETIRPGKLVKEDNNWRITQKSLVKVS